MLRCCISPGALQQGRLGCARPIKRAAFFGRILCLQGRARRTTMVRLSTQADQMNFQMLIILDLQFFTPHTNNLKNSGKKKENINKQLLLSLFCPLRFQISGLAPASGMDELPLAAMALGGSWRPLSAYRWAVKTQRGESR